MRRLVSLSLILLINVICLRSANAQVSISPRLSVTIEKIDSLTAAEYAKDNVGSVTVGLVVNSALVWTKSYGYADGERKILATKETVYRIASVTKLFTGVMLLQLVERGRVHLSDPVEKYLPEVNRIQGRFAGAPPITLVQLATMTAGLDGEPRNAERYNTGRVSDWEKLLILSLPDTKYLYEPGAYHNYSNSSYAILGAALGRAADEPYVGYVQKHIIEPLRMTHTAFEPDTRINPLLAKGYHFENGKLDLLTPQRQQGNRGKNVPAGSLYSTVGDLARFMEFELGAEHSGVLKKETLENSFSALVAADSDLNYGDGMGGFSALRLMSSNFVAVGHLGALPGYSAALIFDRRSSTGVIMLSNVTNGKADYQELAQRALAILVDKSSETTK